MFDINQVLYPDNTQQDGTLLAARPSAYVLYPFAWISSDVDELGIINQALCYKKQNSLDTKESKVPGHQPTSSLQVNYLGPYHLTRLLQPRLAASTFSRVVNVSSIMHRAASVDSNIHRFLTDWNKGSQYANTKLANVLFTYEAQRRWASRPGAIQASFYCLIVLS